MTRGLRPAGPDAAVHAESRPIAAGVRAPWWAVPATSVAGLLLVTWAFRLSRANEDLTAARWIFWVALALLVIPAAIGLVHPATGRRARILLVAVAGAGLYLVKVLHNPVRFGFPDEWVHLANAQGILDAERLYPVPGIIPASRGFPGLEAATVALSRISGTDLFTSGLILIGVTKVAGLVALFLLVERVTASARVGGLAALAYGAAPNFLFWSAQYSYESLSLPLVFLTLLAVVAHRDRRLAGERGGPWAACAVVLITGIAVTHHVSGYALAVLLWAMVAVDLAVGDRRRAAPIALATIATLAPLAWMLFVAGDASGYLGGIFSRAWSSLRESLLGEGSTRAPFQSTGGGGDAAGPTLDDAALAVGSVLLVTAGVLYGGWTARRRRWPDPFAVVLMLGGPLLLLAFAMRLFPGAWETANRATNLLEVGAAMLCAIAAVRLDEVTNSRIVRSVLLPGAAFVLIAGGLVIGWQADARLARAFEAKAGSVTRVTESRAFVDWARANLPADSRLVADESASRLLAVSGFPNTPAARSGGVPQLLTDPDFPDWERQVIVDRRIDFIVLDRRDGVDDAVTGVYLPRPGDDLTVQANASAVRASYDSLPGVRRVYDSGDIVVFDVRAISEGRG